MTHSTSTFSPRVSSEASTTGRRIYPSFTGQSMTTAHSDFDRVRIARYSLPQGSGYFPQSSLYRVPTGTEEMLNDDKSGS